MRHDPRSASYAAAGAALAKMLAAAPHSARRKAEEALERMTGKCPHCEGEGKLHQGYYEFFCWRCDGTGEIAVPEPLEDEPPQTEREKRADDDWFADDTDRYLRDLNEVEAA